MISKRHRWTHVILHGNYPAAVKALRSQMPAWMQPDKVRQSGFKYFLFSPLLGEMIQFDEHIFQMG